MVSTIGRKTRTYTFVTSGWTWDIYPRADNGDMESVVTQETSRLGETQNMRMGNRKIGYGYPPVVCAELGINHSGDLMKALRMIDAAHKCGAQAIKCQYFKASDFSVPGNKKVRYEQFVSTAWSDPSWIPGNGSNVFLKKITEDEHAFFTRHEVDLDFVKACRERTWEHEMLFGVTCTSAEGVREVINLGVDFLKLASDMVGNRDLIDEMWSCRVPKIVSTGHLSLQELEYGFGTHNLVLHCVSSYPAKNPKLWRIAHMREMGYTVGYSHHSRGIQDAVRAAELGAVWLEVHTTLGHDMPGSDHHWSLDPMELSELSLAVG